MSYKIIDHYEQEGIRHVRIEVTLSNTLVEQEERKRNQEAKWKYEGELLAYKIDRGNGGDSFTRAPEEPKPCTVSRTRLESFTFPMSLDWEKAKAQMKAELGRRYPVDPPKKKLPGIGTEL